jgi:Na+-transporting methylmalonyl-CoA/oxaloacetate decarboxylase gamma subunit
MYDEQLPFHSPTISSTPKSLWLVPAPRTRTAEEQFQFDLQCQREHFQLELQRPKDAHEGVMMILRMASVFTKLILFALMVYLIAGMVSDVRCVRAPEAKAVIETKPAINAAPATERVCLIHNCTSDEENKYANALHSFGLP